MYRLSLLRVPLSTQKDGLMSGQNPENHMGRKSELKPHRKSLTSENAKEISEEKARNIYLPVILSIVHTLDEAQHNCNM
jgi:hypothetical protein